MDCTKYQLLEGRDIERGRKGEQDKSGNEKMRDLSRRRRNGGGSVSMLLEAQNTDGQTALHLACRRGSAELVGVILEYKQVDVGGLDKDGNPPLVFSLAAGSAECVRALIMRGENVRSKLRDCFGPSVAHVCAYHGQPDCMRELLLAGADPNAKDDKVKLSCIELSPRNIPTALLLFKKFNTLALVHSDMECGCCEKVVGNRFPRRNC